VTVDESWEDAKLSLQLAEPVISEKQSTKESNLTQKAKNSIGRNPSKRNHSRPQSQRFNVKLFGENGLFAKYGGEKSLEGAENGEFNYYGTQYQFHQGVPICHVIQIK